ncbi:MAG: AbrB/MazE/SpoVT family DNA-binding domain-containing protein [Candidatus Marinimicrobia bacterium]|nr:AbrB/MazE/SpoVT family DNA-binding domain-containing protein [Candidatus Neomarinimicrobiota bacterium]MCH8069634.1 AbrB/MazE/SpoVT family DNA-binding domain-containing protein [Candidatus Neomarinimicrobiota bacterium]
MIISKLTSKAQTTIPKEIREKLDLHAHDTIVYTVEGDHAIFKKITLVDNSYLRALEHTLEEWNSPEDEEAYHNL